MYSQDYIELMNEKRNNIPRPFIPILPLDIENLIVQFDGFWKERFNEVVKCIKRITGRVIEEGDDIVLILYCNEEEVFSFTNPEENRDNSLVNAALELCNQQPQRIYTFDRKYQKEISMTAEEYLIKHIVNRL